MLCVNWWRWNFYGCIDFNQEFNFPVIGIPGTIDNDIFGTSHTLGYDTALEYCCRGN